MVVTSWVEEEEEEEEEDAEADGDGAGAGAGDCASGADCVGVDGAAAGAEVAAA